MGNGPAGMIAVQKKWSESIKMVLQKVTGYSTMKKVHGCERSNIKKVLQMESGHSTTEMDLKYFITIH